MPVSLKTPFQNLASVDLRRESSVRFDKIRASSFCDGSLTVDTVCPMPDGILGAAYLQTLIASGGNPPYTWSIVAGSLPPGLTLSGDIISGIPTN